MILKPIHPSEVSSSKSENKWAPEKRDCSNFSKTEELIADFRKKEAKRHMPNQWSSGGAGGAEVDSFTDLAHLHSGTESFSDIGEVR